MMFNGISGAGGGDSAGGVGCGAGVEFCGVVGGCRYLVLFC